MRKRFVSTAIAVLSIPALGLLSYGAVHAVSATPAPQSVIAASWHLPNGPGGADDPAGHDANDNRGGAAITTVNRTAAVATQTTVRDRDGVAGHDAAGHDAVGHDVGDVDPTPEVGEDVGGGPTTTPTSAAATTATSTTATPTTATPTTSTSTTATSTTSTSTTSTSTTSRSGPSGHGPGGANDGSGHR